MIATIKPRGAIAESLFLETRTFNGKFYIVDIQYNVYEVSEEEYLKWKGE